MLHLKSFKKCIPLLRKASEITLDISMDILGHGRVQFDSFTVKADKEGNYTFTKHSIPKSAWASFSDLIDTNTVITNVSVDAYIGDADLMKSNVASQSILSHTSPLILDLNGDGVQTIATEEGISFDIDNDTKQEFTGWVSAEDGLLVRDINLDGNISDASELFGEFTQKSNGEKASDGFDALADLDSNKDGVFDALDTAFDEVKVWQDANSDGISQANELHTLEQMGVKSIDLNGETISEENNGNQVGLRSSWTDTDDNKHNVDDVWFKYNRLEDETAAYVKVIHPDEYINAQEVGDPSNEDSGIQVKILIPPATATSERLLISIDYAGDNNSRGKLYDLTAEDFSRGYLLINLPNAQLQNADGDYNQGFYEISLSKFTVGGGRTKFAGKDSFILDTIAPDAPVVEIVNGDDNVLNIEELTNDVRVNVTLSANTVAGDKLEIDFNGDGIIDQTYIVKAKDVGGTLHFDVSAADLGVSTHSKIAKVTAKVTDVGGQYW